MPPEQPYTKSLDDFSSSPNRSLAIIRTNLEKTFQAIMNTPSEPKKSTQSPGGETHVIPFKSEAPVPSDGAGQPSAAAVKAREVDATKQFHDFLLSGSGADFGLTYEKFVSRSTSVREADGKPGAFVVSVERHRAVAGGTYHKGSPMAAYETYTQQILFDPATGAATDLPDEHRDYDINIYGLAAKTFGWDWNPVVSRKAAWKRKRRVNVPIMNYVFETSSYDEARCRIEDQFRNLNHESQFEGLDLPTDEISNLIAKFEEAFTRLALNALESGWAEPELADD